MAQVLIVGGGVVGAAIAYELSCVPGLEVILCDRDRLGQGSTGAALGVLMGAISQKKAKSRAWKLREQSLQRYLTLIPELEAKLDCYLPRNDAGILKLCSREENWSKWQALAQVRCEQGFPLALWSLDELCTRFPQLGREGISGAVFSSCDRQIQPRPLTEALLAAAELQGVQVNWETEITDIEMTTGDPRRCGQVMTQTGEPYEPDWLVIAAGLGTTLLTEQLQRAIAVRPVLGQAVRYRLSQPFPERFPVVTGGDVHVVPLSDYECWVGATVEFPDAAGQVTADERLLEEVQEAAIALYPPLAEAEVIEQWSGLRPRPEGRSAPVIGKLENYENVLLATGHYRNGVLLAPATAIAIRDLISPV
ncbi:MAG: FAD-binding oxidoreductase [Phormidium sp. BM_Day4_Bin.17]|nr:FAD-binding oxidoreductase [Phormidium sp. BM_Day4_Bin.17]UCJ10721.1 MAG: FAD-dependent oxidoreductase [Phormidium sp. PBR-2020]